MISDSSNPKQNLRLSYSLADQNFEQTKSIGILNLSVHLANALSRREEFSKFQVLSNPSLRDQLNVADSTTVTEHSFPISGKIQRTLWDQSGVYHAANKSGNEWLFLPKGFASFMRRPPVKLAAYVHDVMLDYYAEKYPGAMSSFEIRYFRKALRATLKHASVIFTNSEFTKGEVSKLAKRENITAPPIVAAGIGFADSKPGVIEKRDLIVVLASAFPHKRTSLAVEFLSRWQEGTRYSGMIHWVGKLPDGLEFPDFPNWERSVRQAEGEYRKLLSESKSLVYFTEYEGFGMPPIEATLAGSCPVFSSVPATDEVMLGHGCPFSNEDYGSFASAIDQSLSVSPDVLQEWKSQLLERHNWDSVSGRIVKTLLETG